MVTRLTKNLQPHGIMVAVRDFERSAKALLRKAADLAMRLEAPLWVLHVSDNSTEAFRIPGLINPADTLQQLEKIQAQRLQQLVKPLQKRGIAVEALSSFDYPVGDAIVRQVLKYKPSLLMIHAQKQSGTARWFLRNIDWELIRDCPCPVWVVKNNRLNPSLAALAAVDPFHSFDKPAQLDNVVLEAAGQLVGTGKGRLGLCHAYLPPQQALAAMGELTLAPISQRELNRLKTDARNALRELATRYAVSSKDVLLVEGAAATAIPKAAKRWKADVLVTGALSRRGIKRLFIGNTAERLLDAAPCDVLVVKPRGFKTSVKSKSK